MKSKALSLEEADEALVERTRKFVAEKRKVQRTVRWLMLLDGLLLIGFAGWFTLKSVRKFQLEQLTEGFVYGAALAVVWFIFGVPGGVCLANFLDGLQGAYRSQELLIQYHDRIRELEKNIK